MTTNTTAAHVAALRGRARTRYVAELQDGRRQRAAAIPPKKGRGSYRRGDKYASRDLD